MFRQLIKNTFNIEPIDSKDWKLYDDIIFDFLVAMTLLGIVLSIISWID